MLFVFLVLVLCIVAVTSEMMMLPSIPRILVTLPTVSHRPFCEMRLGPLAALDKLFFHSCDLHVLHVVLTLSQPTPHVTAHMSPYKGGSPPGHHATSSNL